MRTEFLVRQEQQAFRSLLNFSCDLYITVRIKCLSRAKNSELFSS
jgi:hypothetical protein